MVLVKGCVKGVSWYTFFMPISVKHMNVGYGMVPARASAPLSVQLQIYGSHLLLHFWKHKG